MFHKFAHKNEKECKIFTSYKGIICPYLLSLYLKIMWIRYINVSDVLHLTFEKDT